jgi:hypothetical protein
LIASGTEDKDVPHIFALDYYTKAMLSRQEYLPLSVHDWSVSWGVQAQERDDERRPKDLERERERESQGVGREERERERKRKRDKIFCRTNSYPHSESKSPGQNEEARLGSLRLWSYLSSSALITTSPSHTRRITGMP